MQIGENNKLFPKEIEIRLKKKILMRLVPVAMLINLIVIVLMQPDHEKTSPPIEDKVKVSLQLSLNIPFESNIKGTLFYKNKLIAKEVILIKKIDSNTELFESNSHYFEVLVKKEDLKNVLKNIKKTFTLNPPGVLPVPTVTQRRGAYEIVF